MVKPRTSTATIMKIAVSGEARRALKPDGEFSGATDELDGEFEEVPGVELTS